MRYLLLISLALALALPVPGSAQSRVPIRFDPGTSGATINGAIVGSEYIDYILNARAGQRMIVSLDVTGTNGYGIAYFNILPAGQDFGGPYTGHMDDDNRADVILPESRDWAIRVYLMGNDRDAGATVGYTIRVDIPPPSGASSAPAPGRPLLPEEDLFIVRLSSPGGLLNMRDEPRASARLVGTLRNGTTVSNVGGCLISNGAQWCRVRAPGGGASGWVSARYLALPGPGGAPAGLSRVSGVPAGDLLNVRSGPGTGNAVVGVLGNGDQVRLLTCQQVGSSRWCQIEMQTDMRERGWVNARYLQ